MADSPQRTDDDLHAEVKVLLTEEIRRARRRAGERSEAERRVLEAARVLAPELRDWYGSDRADAFLAAVDVLDEVNAKGGTGEQR